MTGQQANPARNITVTIDATPALSGVTGVARYTRQLLSALSAEAVTMQCFAIGRGRGELPPGTQHIRVPLRVVQPVWRWLGRPRAEQLANDSDVFHSLDLAVPPTRLPVVATIHDLAALDRPDLHEPAATQQMQRRLDAVASAAVLVSVSHATAAALARRGFDPDRIVVAPLAPTPYDGPVVTPEIPQPYLLAVGEVTARKDYETLVRAVAAADIPDIRLVVAGPLGYRAGEVQQLVDRLRVRDRVRLLGQVSDAELAGLYRGALACCSSSVAEGFGLPLVEAMNVGLPIAASDIDVFREVADDAAIYAPAGDSASFAAVLNELWTDPELRARLSAAGRERAANFSWQRTAALTVDAYRRALACT